MNIRYIGLSGEVYYVDEKKLAKGGEGSVHVIENHPGLVAKIFKAERRTPEREKKLSLMVKAEIDEEQLQQITWPRDVIYEVVHEEKKFVGYVMSKLNRTDSLNEIYSSNGKQYDLRYRLLAAFNLCAAVQTVHEMGQVCGDLNPQNICINLDLSNRENACQITLVDTDSYHFASGDEIYRCEVGLADYIAPELQSKMTNGLDLKNAPLPTYTKETDLFAVAVHIYTLLMNGCHPFACAKETNGFWKDTMKQASGGTIESVVAPQPIENVREGFFPVFDSKPGVACPVYAPEFEYLPQKLRYLFIKSFVGGYYDPAQRVGTQEWMDELKQIRKDICCCNVDQGHYYFLQNTECPLCKVNERMKDLIQSNREFITKDTRDMVLENKEREKKTEEIEPEGKKMDAVEFIGTFILVTILIAILLAAIAARFNS